MDEVRLLGEQGDQITESEKRRRLQELETRRMEMGNISDASEEDKQQHIKVPRSSTCRVSDCRY